MSVATRDRLLDSEGDEGASVEIGIIRRTTAEALELITRSETQKLSHRAWYEPGRDFCFYAAAHDACRATKKRLDADELEIVGSANGLDALLQKIQRIIEIQEQPSRKHPAIKKAGQFVEAFSEFVTRTSGIIELLVPQSPEYRMTYGVLLLVFTTIYKKKETQDSLLTYIKTLSERLPIIDFYSKVFPSNGMKLRVVYIYVEILNFLNEAIVYCRSNHLRKLRDAVLRPVETKFDKHTQRIEAEIKKLDELKEAAHVAQQADIKELLESTGQVIGRLHDNLNHSMIALSSCFALLDARIEKVTHQSSAIYNFQATNHAIALTELLLPTESTANEQLSLVRKQHFDLSPKDHWFEIGVLREFEKWSAHGRREVLWIGGRSGNQDTWITEMSKDLIDALSMQDLTLLHVFCDTDESAFTIKTLLKRLIAQLLDLHPDIPFRRPGTYSLRRFRRATTFPKLWTIFEELVGELTSSVFVLIDRIEECDADEEEEGGGDEDQLLRFLMGWARETEHVSVIVTSTYGPPEEFVGEKDLRHFYRDTRRSRGKRER